MTEPVPDEKDWTWTITRACPECGFDPAAVERADVPARTLAHAAELRSAALAPDGTARPSAAVWSPLEYACHVRDVCELFEHRLSLMLTEDDPLFANWDQDETALAQRYREQEPRPVADGLTRQAEVVAARFAAVRDDQWARPGHRSNGSRFTIDTFARYFLHDLAHHAWDVRPAADPAAVPNPPGRSGA